MKTLKHIFLHNFWLKLLSILAAAVIWLLIINITDPIITETFEDIPVKIINEEIVTSKGYQYSVISGETTDVHVKGKRSIVSNLKKELFYAEADLNQLSTMYLTQISVSYSDVDQADLIEITPKTDAVSIKLEESVTEPFNIRVVLDGEVKDGYTVISKELSTNVLQVTGSQTQVEKIKEIVVKVGVNDKKDSFTITASPIAYDLDGEIIDSMKLSYNQETIDVSVTIYPVKEIELEFITIGSPARAHRIEDVEFAPSTILIAGKEENLESISKISIPWNVNGIEESVDANIILNDELSADFKSKYVLVDQQLNVGLKINVIQLTIRDIVVSEKDIELRRLDENLECEFRSSMFITMRLIGTAEEVSELTIDDLHPYISFSNCTEGDYAAIVRTDYTGIVTVEPGTTMVTLVKKTTDDDETSND